MALLPIILLFILVLARDRRLIGGLRNGPVSQFLGWGTFVIVTSAVLVLLSTQVLGAFVAGGGPLRLPGQSRTFRGSWLRVTRQNGRPLPVHADGEPTGGTPAEFQIEPAALRLIVRPSEESGICAWAVVGPVAA
jgi:YegS C-terminal NAD kinase beta sandwich-like domain